MVFKFYVPRCIYAVYIYIRTVLVLNSICPGYIAHMSRRVCLFIQIHTPTQPSQVVQVHTYMHPGRWNFKDQYWAIFGTKITYFEAILLKMKSRYILHKNGSCGQKMLLIFQRLFYMNSILDYSTKIVKIITMMALHYLEIIQ